MRTSRFSRIPSMFKRSVFAITLVTTFASSSVVMAQSGELLSLQNEVKSLREAIGDLQLKVFKGENPEAVNLVQGAGGVTSSQVGQVQSKVLAVEEQLRDMMGQYEVLDNRARRIENRLDKLIEDIDFRLTALERGGAAVSNANGAQQNLVPAQQDQTVIVSNAPTTNAAVVQTPATTNNNTLGTLTGQQIQAFENGQGAVQSTDPNAQATVNTGQGTTPAVAPLPTPAAVTAAGAVTISETAEPLNNQGTDTITVQPRFASPEEEYRAAYELLQRHDYDGAQASMQQFIDHHPDHTLVGNAMYWLGETHYARKEYREAMSVFAKTYQHDENGRKAADSLLKLGMSLAQLGQMEQSCATYDILLTQHTKANQVVVRRTKQRKEAQNCPASQ